jgi:hypothetical protein
MDVKCSILSELNHDNNVYGVGTEAILPVQVAGRLQDIGVVKVLDVEIRSFNTSGHTDYVVASKPDDIDPSAVAVVKPKPSHNPSQAEETAPVVVPVTKAEIKTEPVEETPVVKKK